MNEYTADYKSFEEAYESVVKLMESIHSEMDEISSLKTDLSNEKFMGPIATDVLNHFEDVIKKLNAEKEQFSEISSTLKSIVDTYQKGDSDASKKLSNNSESKLNTTTSSNSVANTAVKWAIGVANDNSYGYVSGGMGNGGYDCTQLIHAAYEAAGVSLPEKGYVNNSKIVDYYTKNGFTWHQGPIDPNELQAGDVLVNQAHHAELYIGDGKKLGAHDNYDSGPGDSYGNEISIDNYHEYSNGGWDGYLRYNG